MRKNEKVYQFICGKKTSGTLIARGLAEAIAEARRLKIVWTLIVVL